MAVDTLSLDFGRDKRFYVYLYRDPRRGKRQVPIYVGKGTASYGRADIHWKYGSDNPFLSSILEKIRRVGLSPLIEIISWFDSEVEAFDLECALIQKFGRRDLGKGTLANLTNGGDGASGNIQSEQSRRKKSAAIRAAKAALATDPEWRAKQSAQRSALRRSAWENPETRALYVESIRAAKEAKRAAMNAMWADPEYRAEHAAKVGAAARAAWANPETRAKRIAAAKATKARRRQERELPPA